MTLAPAKTSELIRNPIPNHLRFIDQHADFVWDHISYCATKTDKCLVMFCLDGSTVQRGYLPMRHCSVITLMAYGFEEHEAIEIEIAVQACNLRHRAPVLVASVEFKSGLVSFVEVEV